MNKCNLLLLSKYRKELLGVCTCGVILCHANLANVALPAFVKKILGEVISA